jgi:hypothetical protein
MKAHIEMRRLYGWEPFQDDDEKWSYHLEEGKRNCPICQGYFADKELGGDRIRSELPFARLESSFEAKPETHLANPYYRDGEYYKSSLGEYECYCHMNLLNPSTTLAQRLKRELEEI